MTLILPVTIWTCGAPLAVAVAGTFAYRALTLWLPMPFALVSLPALRRLSRQSLPGRDGSRNRPRVGQSGETIP
jgi:hypothetical protein